MGTIVALSPPHLLRIAGPFSFENACVHAQVSFALKESDGATRVIVTHHAIGDHGDSETKSKWNSVWQHFLAELKGRAETNLSPDSGGNSPDAMNKNQPTSTTLAQRTLQYIGAVAKEIQQGNVDKWLKVVDRLESLTGN